MRIKNPYSKEQLDHIFEQDKSSINPVDTKNRFNFLKFIKSITLKILIITFILAFGLLSGCGIFLAIPLMYLSAYQYEKDVSDHPARGALVGKQYVLIQDAILYTYKDEPKKFHLDRNVLDVEMVKKNGQKSYVLKNKSCFSFHTIISKETILKINRITIEAGFDGNERCTQNIYATFLFEGKEKSANVSYLFKNRFNSPNEEWNFLPKSDIIEEIFN